MLRVIAVDRRRWWVVRHLNGYCAWLNGELFVTPNRLDASRFSSARLAFAWRKKIAHKGSPHAPYVTRVTRRRAKKGG
jgi:hypothetical protein